VPIPFRRFQIPLKHRRAKSARAPNKKKIHTRTRKLRGKKGLELMHRLAGRVVHGDARHYPKKGLTFSRLLNLQRK
jgi:hypothetical protein